VNEEQAKSKLCPLLSVGNGQSPCIGSACMMWRWNGKPNPEWKSERYSLMQQFPPRDERFDPPPMIADETSGRCGLAGYPPPPSAPSGDGSDAK
jgi:hypothetical protein